MAGTVTTWAAVAASASGLGDWARGLFAEEAAVELLPRRCFGGVR
jgi:hypothetical protein